MKMVSLRNAYHVHKTRRIVIAKPGEKIAVDGTIIPGSHCEREHVDGERYL